MVRFKTLFILLIFFVYANVSGQVKIRLFANKSPLSAVFTVTHGRYELNLNNGVSVIVEEGEPVILMKYDNRLAIKTGEEKGYICDSVFFAGKTGEDSFSLRINEKSPVRQVYSGNLGCYPDFGTILFINNSDIEKYISGVVMAEGGSGKNLEYFKTQAIIARTYMYRSFGKHMSDKYNVCDNTHCQAFNGMSTDPLLNIAAMDTKGLVILDKDSALIESAFHSNCGGETSSSEDVWLIPQTYLKGVVDPYCVSSRSATWRKSIPLTDWLSYLGKSGYQVKADSSRINFSQATRLTEYKTTAFSIPLQKVRADMNLRSTYFSVYLKGDSVILAGRGYGHGVGLCQEGAMVMASKGIKYREIINFYYSRVFISDIKNAVNLPAKPVVKTFLYRPSK
jgi:stage II sporulation protein D